ncbi:poly(A) RNA binding protein [Epichloe bromicola]|uniref:Poly(A) RNA binding protein n=1 Tax=Epichloe bromicola TaxID=79588 RepID=A0ABQ0CYF7_9HYPO
MAVGSNIQGSSDALSECRRIYLGNLLYTVEAKEIEEGLRENGFGDFEAVQLSVDPVSGRNPGYCFVDFVNHDGAERALESLNATIRGRALKVGPCKPKQPRSNARWGSDGRSPSFQRWGDEGASPRHGSTNGHDRGQRTSSDHVEEAVGEDSGKRVYVGGLSPSVDQALDTAEVTELFAGFAPVTISNRIKPRESTSALPGNHHYCFVEFGTREEAQSAIDTLNGKVTESGPLRVSVAKPPSNKQRGQRSSPYNNKFGHRPRRGPRDQDGPQADSSPAGARSMASDNWRCRVD